MLGTVFHTSLRGLGALELLVNAVETAEVCPCCHALVIGCWSCHHALRT